MTVLHIESHDLTVYLAKNNMKEIELDNQQFTSIQAF